MLVRIRELPDPLESEPELVVARGEIRVEAHGLLQGGDPGLQLRRVAADSGENRSAIQVRDRNGRVEFDRAGVLLKSRREILFPFEGKGEVNDRVVNPESCVFAGLLYWDSKSSAVLLIGSSLVWIWGYCCEFRNQKLHMNPFKVRKVWTNILNFSPQSCPLLITLHWRW